MNRFMKGSVNNGALAGILQGLLTCMTCMSCVGPDLQEEHPVLIVGPSVCEVGVEEDTPQSMTKQDVYVALSGLDCAGLVAHQSVFSQRADLGGHIIYSDVETRQQQGACVLHFSESIANLKDGTPFPPPASSEILALCPPHIDSADPQDLVGFDGFLTAARVGSAEQLVDLIDDPVPIGVRGLDQELACIPLPETARQVDGYTFVAEYDVTIPQRFLPRLYGARLHLAVQNVASVE